ncbi:MAG: extracellular solute-binding protein, partial [Candidatus Paceibacterota bacterium]
MKISLFQTILFGIFGVGALIGLFVFATHTGNTSSNVVGTVVIWGTLPKEGMQSTLIAAGQTETLLRNVSYVQKDPQSLASDLASAIATGSAPDLILASQEQLHALAKFIATIPLATLPARTFESSFIEEGRIFAIPGGGGYYGVPFLLDPLVLFSNHSILASNGIARPPATWEALTGLVPQIAQLTPSRQVGRGLIALGTYNNVHDARGILSALFLQTGIPVSGYSPTGVLAADLGDVSNVSSPGHAVLGFYTQFTD